MRKVILICLMMVQSVFAKEKYPDDQHTINWSDRKTLSYSYLQMCDDSYYPNLRLVIPGRINHDFNFKIDTKECSITQRPASLSGSNATELLIKGGCVGTIQVFKSGTLLKAEIDLSDAC